MDIANPDAYSAFGRAAARVQDMTVKRDLQAGAPTSTPEPQHAPISSSWNLEDQTGRDEEIVDETGLPP